MAITMKYSLNTAIVKPIAFKIKTATGFELHPELEYRPQDSVSVCGRVLHPIRLTKAPTRLLNGKYKPYHGPAKLAPNEDYTFWRYNELVQLLKVGDVVYHTYQDNDVFDNFDYTGNRIIPYENVLGYVDETKRLQAMPNKILMFPIEVEEVRSNLIFLNQDEEDNFVKKAESKGLGVVFSVGPLAGGRRCDIQVGDVVAFDNATTDLNYMVEGQKVFAVNYEQCLISLGQAEEQFLTKAFGGLKVESPKANEDHG